jgi:hypothetical protein
MKSSKYQRPIGKEKEECAELGRVTSTTGLIEIIHGGREL